MTAPWLKRVSVVATLGGLLVATACHGQNAPNRVEGWRGDLELLVSEARRVHAGPARPAHGPAFTEAAADLAKRIPELPDRRIVVELQRLLALLGDGHSLVYPAPSPHASFSMLPIDLYWFEDGLFIVDAAAPAQDLIGSRILAFGPRKTEEVLRDLEPYVSRDNSMGIKAFASLYLVLPEFLEALGAAVEGKPVVLTVRDRSNQSRQVELTAAGPRRLRKRLYPPANTAQPPPLYLQRADREYWLKPDPEHDAVYVQLNQVTDAPDLPLAQFAANLRESLVTSGANHLILDVRHNSGGNNLLLDPLIEAMVGFASGAGENRVYVLTSRATFSAAQNLINRLERRIPGILFAGEPSMSSPNFTGEDSPLTLPYSGLTVSISTRHWQDSSPDDRRPWIEPHLPVAMRSQDWQNNTDPVLEAVHRAIQARANPANPRP